MFNTLYRSVMATLLLGLLVSGAYPLIVYGIGTVLFHDQAGGGLIERNGQVVGARLIGQAFIRPEYLHGRPSSAGDKGYDAANSSGSNLGPTNQKFHDTLSANIEAVLKENPKLKRGEVPTDLVTASGSGLDPHISPEGAMVQLDRVAQARHVSVDQIRQLVEAQVEGPQWGIFGEPVVNVLMTNLALDTQFPVSANASK
jgi:potassium-transporting ATPase KdpC subunit